MAMTVTVSAALRALHSSDKRDASEFISQASGEIERLKRERDNARKELSDLRAKSGKWGIV